MCCALPPGLAACAAYPAAGSLEDFQVTGCLSFCFPSDVGWASALPFFFCASPAPAGLQGFAGFCTLCQGVPVVGGVCSLDDCVVTLLALPYLRVGELLDSGVYDVSWLRSLRFRLPFVVRPPFHVCLPFACSWVGVVWSQVCDPTYSSWVLGSSGVSIAPF